MLRLLSSKAQRRKDFGKPSKPCHVGIHWIALTVFFQLSTHLPGVLHHFVLAKLAISSIRVKLDSLSSEGEFHDVFLF